MPALRILGPLVLCGPAGEAALGGDKPRRLLAVLALHANEVVSVDYLTDALWDQRPPRSARDNLQTYVWSLRRAIGATAAASLSIEATPPGYMLRADPAELDWLRFGRLAAAAQERQAHDPAEAAKLLREALGLWRGPVLGGAADDLVPLRPRLTAMAEARLAALEQRLRAELELGRHRDLLGELAELCGAHPLREELAAMRMLALYRSGRQAEALAAFRELRARLVAELGVDPAAEVQRLHEAMLRADPWLTGPGQPTAAARRVPRQLPAPASGFAGRDAELDRLTSLLEPDASVLVLAALTGTPGVGKTALAVRWAHTVQDRFPDGTLFADLRGYDAGNPPAEPGEVLDGFLRALAVPPEDIPLDTVERAGFFRTLLAGKRLLIVLDNAFGARQVRPLLPGSPGCMVLVTSRNRLAGLAVREGAVLLGLPPLPERESVVLLERTAGSSVAATEVARLCGGLPLALRIAADRAGSGVGLSGLAAQLSDERRRLELLSTDDEDVAVRAVFGSSYRGLPESAARMFRLCGTQPAPEFSVAAAAAAAAINEAEAGRALDELAGSHLLEPTGLGRMRIHDLLAVYAAERIGPAERSAATRRLLGWYLHTADAAAGILIPRRARPVLNPAPDDIRPLRFADYDQAFGWCDAERENLVAATRQALAAGELETAWRLPAALSGYLKLSRRWDDWIGTHQVGLEAASRLGDIAARAWLLTSLGGAYGDLREYSQAADCFAEALGIHGQSGDTRGQSAALLNLGFLSWKRGRFDDGIGYFAECLRVSREAADSYAEAMALNNLGEAYLQLGRFTEALGRLSEALTVFGDTGDKYNQAMVLDSLGNCQRGMGNLAESARLLTEAVALRTQTGDRQGEATSLANLAETSAARGDQRAATEQWKRALSILEDLGDPEADQIRARLADDQHL